MNMPVKYLSAFNDKSMIKLYIKGFSFEWYFKDMTILSN